MDSAFEELRNKMKAIIIINDQSEFDISDKLSRFDQDIRELQEPTKGLERLSSRVFQIDVEKNLNLFCKIVNLAVGRRVPYRVQFLESKDISISWEYEEK